MTAILGTVSPPSSSHRGRKVTSGYLSATSFARSALSVFRAMSAFTSGWAARNSPAAASE